MKTQDNANIVIYLFILLNNLMYLKKKKRQILKIYIY